MTELDTLAQRFDGQRHSLRAVAYRMLGSFSEADDALQEAWLRVSRADVSRVENIGGWFTTVVGRICLNMLRSRAARREHPLETHVPDPVVSRPDGTDPEHQAVVADSVGLAMLIVLDTLSPAERVAFVLHDIFAVPFDDVASILESSSAAARQLASRARKRVQAAPEPDVEPARQREVVDAFFAASRDGDFEALVAVLDPDIVLRSDGGRSRESISLIIRGAATVAGRAVTFSQLAPYVRPALVNGAAGVVVLRNGRPLSVLGFVVRNDRIVAIDVLADPRRLATLDISAVAN